MASSRLKTSQIVASMVQKYGEKIASEKNQQTAPVKRAKSMTNLGKTSTNKFTERIQSQKQEDKIANQISNLQNNLYYKYEVYSKEVHIDYHNQMMSILSEILGIIVNTHNPILKTKMSTYIEQIKDLYKILNRKLPTQLTESPKIVLLNQKELVAPESLFNNFDVPTQLTNDITPKVKILLNKKVPVSASSVDVIKETIHPNRVIKTNDYIGVSKAQRPLKKVYSKQHPVNIRQYDPVFQNNALKKKSLEPLNTKSLPRKLQDHAVKEIGKDVFRTNNINNEKRGGVKEIKRLLGVGRLESVEDNSKTAKDEPRTKILDSVEKLVKETKSEGKSKNIKDTSGKRYTGLFQNLPKTIPLLD